jgi:polar amino acid transport system substrate-binding protein
MGYRPGMTILSAVAADLARTGVLRASINLGNPVLAQGTPSSPAGVTVDLVTEIAARLGVQARFVCFDAARKSYDAMATGQADLCFLAIEPERAAQVAFTAPYAIIEGVFVVAEDSPIASPADADREGVRIGVKRGSAYDLYLTRTLRHAAVVRGDEGVETFVAQGLEAGAGIRGPVADFVRRNPGLRVVEERFMAIRQAVGTTPDRRPQTVEYLHDVVEELKANGFVAEALRRSGQTDAQVAPAERR